MSRVLSSRKDCFCLILLSLSLMCPRLFCFLLFSIILDLNLTFDQDLSFRFIFLLSFWDTSCTPDTVFVVLWAIELWNRAYLYFIVWVEVCEISDSIEVDTSLKLLHSLTPKFYSFSRRLDVTMKICFTKSCRRLTNSRVFFLSNCLFSSI